jgi:PAS domain S-box-containing protein
MNSIADFFKHFSPNENEFYILVSKGGQIKEFTYFSSQKIPLKNKPIETLWGSNANGFSKRVLAEIQNTVRSNSARVIPFIYGYIPLHSSNPHYWQCNFYPISTDNEIQSILIKFEKVTAFIELGTHSTTKPNMNSPAPIDINLHLKWQQERFRLLVENIKGYAIFMLDKEGYITSWNKGAQAIKQYKANEIIGKHFSIFYTEEARRSNHPRDELNLAVKNGKYEEEGWRVKKDGSYFWANVVITPIYDDTLHLIGFAKVTRDLSEQKKIEILKDEFISVMSHELRTPLTSIRGALSLLNESAGVNLSEKDSKLLNIAQTNCVRLTRLINDVLDMEKLHEGKMAFNCEYTNLRPVVEEAIRLNGVYAREYQVYLTSSALFDAHVHVDTDRIYQVLTNLISNAVKFSPKNGTVDITMTLDEGTVIVSVIDKGPGIPEHFKERIFQRFSQAWSSTDRHKDGTGLGLAISKAIIDQHHGIISYRCSPEEGTVFYFILSLKSKP